MSQKLLLQSRASFTDRSIASELCGAVATAAARVASDGATDARAPCVGDDGGDTGGLGDESLGGRAKRDDAEGDGGVGGASKERRRGASATPWWRREPTSREPRRLQEVEWAPAKSAAS
jgi:hypothetical protein